MEFIKSEIIEFIEYAGFVKNDSRYIFKYKVDNFNWNMTITIIIFNSYMNVYNCTNYLGSFTNLSQLIELLNNHKELPIVLIDNIRKYKLNQIVNII